MSKAEKLWGVPAGTILGKTKCEFAGCGATVEVKLYQNGKAGYQCRGHLEGKSCERDVYCGRRETRPLVDAYLRRQEGKAETKAEIEEEIEEKIEEIAEDGNDQQPIEPTVTAKRERGKRRGSGTVFDSL